MALDWGRLNAGISSKKQIDPRKIFTTLKRDVAKFKRPSDEQGDVLDLWFADRAKTDVTLKMNTGSGKTVVGLLCLQSSLNENVGPAVYITPDNYLLSQVLKEGRALGIAVTESDEDPAFISGDAILVANVWKLINGRSRFGVANEGVKIAIGSLVIDDAHACLATVADQFRIALSSAHPAYNELFELFQSELAHQSASGVLDLKAGDPQVVMTVPFWVWQDRQSDVLRILHPHREKEPLLWVWRLLVDVLPLCQCAFGGGGLEIAPRFIPIDNIPAFSAAKRRIYMTATLADDGVLVSHFQADPKLIAEPIKPKGGGDIGDRMILAPEEINPEISILDLKALAASIALTKNVAVIVPSKKRAEFWADVADQTLSAEQKNMESGVAALLAGHVGLTVFINKYDGIDLPGAACVLLLIDGLPEVNGLLERAEQLFLDGTERQLIRQIQRIEQGMGRGVRSSEDHCVVLLLGSRLTQRLHQPEARRMFSVATRAQLDLGREVAQQAKNKPIAELQAIMNLCLEPDDNWVSAGRNAIVNAEEGDPSFVDPTLVCLRQAFDSARLGRFDLATNLAQRAVNLADSKDSRTKGYLKQQLAEYQHQSDPKAAQELQLAAVRLNRRLVRPIAGIAYSKLLAPSKGQAVSATAYMAKVFLEVNDLLIWTNALIESLIWGEEYSRRFESAVQDLGTFLGFGSQRPETEGRGPDNLWALGGLRYLVIECKSGSLKKNPINKHDCNQLNGSVVWFSSEYDRSCSTVPVLIHPNTRPEHAATLTEGTRIMEEECLTKLKKNLRGYAKALGSRFTDASTVDQQLRQFGLTNELFVSTFTVKAGQPV